MGTDRHRRARSWALAVVAATAVVLPDVDAHATPTAQHRTHPLLEPCAVARARLAAATASGPGAVRVGVPALSGLNCRP